MSPILLLTLAACDTADRAPERPPVEVSVQRVRTGVSGADTMLSLGVLATDDEGSPLPCGDEGLELTVSWSTSGEDGSWTALPSDSYTHVCTNEPRGDVALVVDNSGSEEGYLEDLRRGATVMTDAVLAAGGRASLTRVSTNADVVQALSEDPAALEGALAGLYIADGWTALWDGVRMGNETLGPQTETASDLDDFCAQTGRLGVVAFTDGQENNSADEQDYDHDAYPGDGIDTTFQDLLDLHSGGATTPIYTIGLGDEPDHSSLAALAAATGGRHLAVSSPEDIEGAYALISDYFTATEQVCASVPDDVCGGLWVKVEWTWTDGEEHASGEVLQPVDVDCPYDPTGRTAVILLTLSNPGIEDELAGQLADQAVRWTSPVEEPQVLLVLDENHHDEFWWDADAIATMLEDRGLAVTRLDEEDGGLNASDLLGYDVVWYSNPGYPMDDAATFEALQAFSAAGGGLVLQGDDMAWSYGNAFSMQQVTHLSWEDNGTGFCGHHTNDNDGDDYLVTISEVEHPVTAGLAGRSFLYGDDIDTSTAEDAAEVLATATLDPDVVDEGEECATVPVIVAYEP